MPKNQVNIYKQLEKSPENCSLKFTKAKTLDMQVMVIDLHSKTDQYLQAFRKKKSPENCLIAEIY